MPFSKDTAHWPFGMKLTSQGKALTHRVLALCPAPPKQLTNSGAVHARGHPGQEDERCSEKISGTSKVTQLVAAGVGVQTHICFHPASVPPVQG